MIDLFGNLSQIKQLDTLAHISLVRDNGKKLGYVRAHSFLNIIYQQPQESISDPFYSFSVPDVFDKMKKEYATKYNVSTETRSTNCFTDTDMFPRVTSDMNELIETNKENIKLIKEAKQVKQEYATQTPVIQGKKSRR